MNNDDFFNSFDRLSISTSIGFFLAWVVASIISIAITLAALAGSVWLVVYILQQMGVI